MNKPVGAVRVGLLVRKAYTFIALIADHSSRLHRLLAKSSPICHVNKLSPDTAMLSYKMLILMRSVAPGLSLKVVVRRRDGRMVAAREAPRPLAEVGEEAFLAAARRRRGPAVAVQSALCLLPMHIGIVVVAGRARQLPADLLVRPAARLVLVASLGRDGVGEARDGPDGR